MKTIQITIACVLLTMISVSAQDQDINVLEKFIILDATENGVDITPQLIENEAFLSLYELEGEDAVYFANVWPVAETISHGIVYDAEIEEFKETDETFANDRISFLWKYSNTYDEVKGTARVRIHKIYKPQGIYFEVVVVPEDLDLLVYKGYVEGTLNLNVYDQ
ncbi:hypothetical protein [Salegentibacter maritimus]|uniref:hypothetical protein n=1 Tax=Salegentibacter maritimus TaxID=2794347 RepID=UPI0018E45C97|nr:hypothetical protein [Salegentibacter maritimus]MBI6115975.1 hypothetical protein [Salegentibacter maritimus]